MKKIIFLLFVFSCSFLPAAILPVGIWRGNLQLNDSVNLPVTFSVIKDKAGKYTMNFYNYGEQLDVDRVIIKGDSVKWSMPVFDNEFRCRLSSAGLKGVWVNKMRKDKNVFPFKAILQLDGDTISERLFDDELSFPGKYRITFSPGTPDSSMGIGRFDDEGASGHLGGTIQTETGDFRYLGGRTLRGGAFFLSTFDGAHAMVFWLRNVNGKLIGDFYSGKHWHEKFIMSRDDNFQLRDPLKLTYVVDSTKVNFTFHDLKGNPVSLSDPQFQGKVVIIQVMGTWCPNCMDETAEMSELYRKYHDQGLEIIALAYERTQDTAVVNANIRRVKKKFGAEYTFLNTGKTGAKEASESLPFLNGIMSFPTSIYIDRNGKVREVYTGYNGPATGDAYKRDKENTEILIATLLAEKTK